MKQFYGLMHDTYCLNCIKYQDNEKCKIDLYKLKNNTFKCLNFKKEV